MSLDNGICELCKKSVIDGQARNGATGDHWDCWEKFQRQVEADAKRLNRPELHRLVKRMRDPLA